MDMFKCVYFTFHLVIYCYYRGKHVLCVAVVCLRCGHRSNTYDPLLDVSLDIKNADNLERAFHQFVAPDKLDMDNAYKCVKYVHRCIAYKCDKYVHRSVAYKCDKYVHRCIAYKCDKYVNMSSLRM